MKMTGDTENTQQHLRQWFISHSAIKLSVIETEAKLPVNTIQKFMDGGNLAETHTFKLMDVLYKYGYVKRTNSMNIDAKELRIGNWVKDANSLLPLIITAKIIAKSDDKKLNILPVKLTPELLIDCGFQKKESIEKGLLWVVYVDKKETVFYDFDKECLYLIYEYSYNIINELHFRGLRLTSLQYIHQLQNLYFAITGVELEIKL